MCVMGRIPGHYEWDDDDLTPGTKKEGGLHQNLFDKDGKLKGNARFVPSTESEIEPDYVTEYVYVPTQERRKSKEQEELERQMADFLVLLIERGVVAAKPHVERWWHNSARPFVSKQWSKLRTSRPAHASLDVSSHPTPPQDEEGTASTELALDASARPQMSRAEAQARLLAAIAAQAFADEQMRLVNSAAILDEEGAAGVREAISQMPPEITEELVKRMVTDPTMLSEQSLAELASVLARTATSSRKQLHAPGEGT